MNRNDYGPGLSDPTRNDYRLEPVMRPAMPAAVAGSLGPAPERANSHAVDKARSIEIRLGELITRLCSITDRLDC